MAEKNVQTTINEQNTPTEAVERNFPFFRILYRHIWFIIIVTILCTALGAVYGIKKTAPIYTSSCDLILSVSLDKDNQLLDQSNTVKKTNGTDLSLSKMYVDTVAEIIKSPTVIQVANNIYQERYGVYPYISMWNFNITTTQNSLIMGITYTDGDQKTIDKKLTAVIDAANQICQDEEIKKINAESIVLQPMQNKYDQTSSSNSGMFIGLGFVIGLALTVVISCLLYVFDNKLKEIAELEAITGTSVIAVISNE